MEFSLDQAKKVATKFWWIIIGATILGILVGAIFGRTRTSTTYTSTAQIEIDIKHLEGEYNPGNGSPSYLVGYNTAHSLIPTFEQKIFSKETVLKRVAEEHAKNTGFLFNLDALRKKFSFAFAENALIIELSCTTDEAEESLSLLKLLCKYGLQSANTVSSAVKLQIAKVPVYSYSTTITGASAQQITAMKEKLEMSNDLIYDEIMKGLPETYLQRDDIRNGFSFDSKSNGDVIWSYFSTNRDVTVSVMEYILQKDDNIMTGLTVDRSFLTDGKEPDIEYFAEIATGKPVTSSRMVFYGVVVGGLAFLCGAGLSAILYYKGEKKDSKPEEEKAE